MMACLPITETLVVPVCRAVIAPDVVVLVLVVNRARGTTDKLLITVPLLHLSLDFD